MASDRAPDVRFYPTDREQAEILNVLMIECPGLDQWDYNLLMRPRILASCLDAYHLFYSGVDVPRDFKVRMFQQARNDYPDGAFNPSYSESTWGSHKKFLDAHPVAIQRPSSLRCAVCHGDGNVNMRSCAHCEGTGKVARERAL